MLELLAATSENISFEAITTDLYLSKENPQEKNFFSLINFGAANEECLSTDFETSFTKKLLKRIFDLLFTIPGLILLSPLFLIITLTIKADSPGPAFFRQIRVGKHGRSFLIFKFRTMVDGANRMGKHFTVGADQRITRSGKLLRRFKLDEIPQLINVLRGEMSLVGPRPMVPEHVIKYPPQIRDVVLSVPPGITGFASIAFINENEILGTVKDPDQIYQEQILPIKLNLYMRYIKNQSLWLDFKLILLTIISVLNLLFGLKQKGILQQFVDREIQDEVNIA